MVGTHISPYDPASHLNHDPERERKLLLHKKEIGRLVGKVNERGLTLIPLKMYFKRGKARWSWPWPRESGATTNAKRSNGKRRSGKWSEPSNRSGLIKTEVVMNFRTIGGIV